MYQKTKVPPRFELGSLDSKSRVLTITPWNPYSHAGNRNRAAWQSYARKFVRSTTFTIVSRSPTVHAPAKIPQELFLKEISGIAFNPNLTPRFAENFTIALKLLEIQQNGSINKSADQQCPFKNV
ncbi:hypothetical protein CEXT_130541 [Caerostris extrusa]|uniref:Uncharacterized protein n=1 Tax=Caerostris extrusa TaxID=172846 RepID=A0AAV4NTC9_CAEEX|nr:hypothetical protein CEXT_130541 [Caerostris extrusa]